MGAGRIVHQDLTRIDLAIQNGEFFANPTLTNAVDHAIKNQKAIHILGLLSKGGVHSHEQQIHAMLELAAKRGAKKVYVHAFLDGRDTPPRSAKTSLEALATHCQTLNCGKIASIIGRYYAMDRDKRWDRVQIAYELLAEGKTAYHAATALQGFKHGLSTR